MARSKQYNEQQVVEKQCLCSGEMGMKIPRYVGRGNGNQPVFDLC
jgi:hypothetical protein